MQPGGLGAEPQPKLNLVQFSLKIWHLMATILIHNNFIVNFGFLHIKTLHAWVPHTLGGSDPSLISHYACLSLTIRFGIRVVYGWTCGQCKTRGQLPYRKRPLFAADFVGNILFLNNCVSTSFHTFPVFYLRQTELVVAIIWYKDCHVKGKDIIRTIKFALRCSSSPTLTFSAAEIRRQRVIVELERSGHRR